MIIIQIYINDNFRKAVSRSNYEDLFCKENNKRNSCSAVYQFCSNFSIYLLSEVFFYEYNAHNKEMNIERKTIYIQLKLDDKRSARHEK